MTEIPISARLWAALCHLTIIIWLPIFLKFNSLLTHKLSALLPSGAGICFFYSNPICEEPSVILMLMVVNVINLFFLLSIPSINAFIAFTLWKIKRNSHDFINRHGKEAFYFQLKLAKYTIIVNIIIFVLFTIPFIASAEEILFLIASRLTFLLYLNLIFSLPLYFIQLLRAIILIIVVFRGKFITE